MPQPGRRSAWRARLDIATKQQCPEERSLAPSEGSACGIAVTNEARPNRRCLLYRERMLALTIIATIVAVVSAAVAVLALRQAKRSSDAAEDTLAEAKRSADAAEHSAGAAMITAEADRSADHRLRQPRLLVTVDQLAAHDGNAAIYRVTNEGPADLDSVFVHEPILGEVEGRTRHPVARTGSDYAQTAELGPIALGTYGRFTLSLGSGSTLPQFRVKIVSRVGTEKWTEVILLENPRRPRPTRISTAKLSRGSGE